jgi:HEPN domain-containing protein
VNRKQLQQLAQERAQDAKALLAAKRWSGAYYLAGYAIECGLKACIAKLTNKHDFPDKSLALRCYVHDIEELVKVAGLAAERQQDAGTNMTLGANWQLLKGWDEKARYQRYTEQQARNLVHAVIDANDGVLSWIKNRW